jgi:hypothetical protein
MRRKVHPYKSMEKTQNCRTCGVEIPLGRQKYCDAHPSEKAMNQKEKTEKRSEQGICKSCSEPIAPNSTVFCEGHLIANRERGVKDRQRRKAAGLCRSCNEPIAENSNTWCEHHHEKQNALSRELSKRAREAELCQDCNIEPRMVRKRRCADCQEEYEHYKQTICRRIGCEESLTSDLKHFCREHADEENEKLRQRRQRLKAERKCIFCFNMIEGDDSHILCEDCREKQKEQRRAVVTA